jgi:glutamate 5-kinase
VQGSFARGEMVQCLDTQGNEIARGLVNYAAHECQQLKGHPTSDIESVLGYVDEDCLIHRDNLVITE